MDTIVKVMRALEIAGEELRKERAKRSQFGCSNLGACTKRCEGKRKVDLALDEVYDLKSWEEWTEKDLATKKQRKKTKVEIYTEGDESKEVNFAITMLLANRFEETIGWKGDVEFNFHTKDEEGEKNQEEEDELRAELMALYLERNLPATKINCTETDSKYLAQRIVGVANDLKWINEELKQRIEGKKKAEKFVEDFKKQNGGTQLRDSMIDSIVEDKGLNTFVRESEYIKEWLKSYL